MLRGKRGARLTPSFHRSDNRSDDTSNTRRPHVITIRSILLAGTVTAALAAGGWSVAQSAQPAAAPGAGAAAVVTPPTPRGRTARGPTAPRDLHTAMESIDRVYRAIKADAGNPARQEEALQSIYTFQRDIAISKMYLPKPVESLTGEAKTKAIASYRSMMAGMMRAAMDLEEAVMEKKADEVKACLAQLDELQKQGHAEFAPEVK